MIITIDGPAAAGKGTLAQALALHYSLAYFDTGMIYRAVGLEMVKQNLDVNNKEEAFEIAKQLTFQKMAKLSKDKDFRTDVGSKAASIVSAHPKVRQALLKMQQDFSLNPVFSDGSPADGAIYDGRDTGTVVCPNADVKLFVNASTEVRAKRRLQEFERKGIKTTYEKVFEDMKQRDERDANRDTAPLKPAEDAHILDTSDMDINEVMKKACLIIDSHFI
ncbi:MAG: (d)CMP kinase [Alphaproteobacteria bacterium]